MNNEFSNVSDKKNRMTRQRRVILEELRKVQTHPSADEVYEMVRHRIPHISLGTVYRNLEILSDNGFAMRLEMCGTQMRFDGNAENHYHTRCTKCGRVDDLHIEPIAEIADVIESLPDKTIYDYRLEFLGICSLCER
ncbi:MAG: Fur family transcriptional regulator [Armatimonadota bacterium]